MFGGFVETLAVAPAGLLAAAQRIADQAAALGVPHRYPGNLTERSGAAAAGCDRALDGYRAGLSRQLLAVADALRQLASCYTGADTSSSALLNSVAPLTQRLP